MPSHNRKLTERKLSVPESYLFQIDRIMPDYSFGISYSRFDDGAYSEHAHTEIVATCLVPAKLAGRTTTFTLMGDRHLISEEAHPSDEGFGPKSIGSLTMRGERNEYAGRLPFDALASMSALILAGGVQFILLSGSARKRGTSLINYMAFKKEANPEDY